MINTDVDILIIGGGLTGATLLLALQGLGYSTLLVEAQPFQNKIHPDFDARSLALSPSSQRILNMIGVWERLKEHATPIYHIHVSDRRGFGVSRLGAQANQPLGYVIEMHYLHQAIHPLLEPTQILAPATLNHLNEDMTQATLLTEQGEQTIRARLIVAADGAESLVRQLTKTAVRTKHYNQHAIVTNIGLNRSHENKAYERFTQQGPLALLPMTEKRMSLVWAMQPTEAQTILSLDDRAFLKVLQEAFGYRLGRFIKTGKRVSFPLKQMIMPTQIHWPVVFVGNAAHTLHPVAGQGFNLGLRDIATLAQCIAQNGLDASMLERYAQLRHHDHQVITHLTDSLIGVFTSSLPGMKFARNAGLLVLDQCPPLKRMLARYARGFGGFIPDLVCEMHLADRNSYETSL